MPRTRAMGQSPGGFQSLDMDAPTRKRKTAQTYGPSRQARKTRRARVSEDEPASLPTQQNDQSPPSPAERTSTDAAGEERQRPAVFRNKFSPPKRRNVDATDEERPSKRTRLEEVREEVESVPKPQPPPLPLPELETPAENAKDSSAPTLPASFAAQNTPLEPSKTLPLGEAKRTKIAPEESKRILSRSEVEAKKQSQRRLRNLANMARKPDPEDLGALSDCEDDDEWNRRYKRMISGLQSHTRESPSSTSYLEWSPGSKALFAVKQIDNRGNPCMEYPPFNTPSISHQEEVKIRELTEDSVIVAISASLDWFEKNPDAAVPTAAEMASMLEGFNRSKQPIAPTELPLARQAQPNEPEPATPATQQAPGAAYEPVTPENASSSSPDSAAATHPSPDQDDEPRPGQLMAQTLASETLAQRVEEPQSWAAMISASATNLLRTPLSIFRSRPGRQVLPAQNAPNTDRRPVVPPTLDVEPRSARPRRRREPSTTNVRPSSSHTNASTSRVRPASKTDVLSTQTPKLMPIWKGGKRDSHLPFHLRGVQYKDLPEEWQAVSQHMKPAELIEEEREKEELPLEKISKEAEVSRAAQRQKERREREIQEDELRHTQAMKKPEVVKAPVRRWKASDTPTYSNTICMPEDSDSDDDSSEEAEVDELQEEPEVEGEDMEGGPLWIPRGYKALDRQGYCKAGTEFDLPAWTKIESAEEAHRLATAQNRRLIGLMAEFRPPAYYHNRHFVPVLNGKIPTYIRRWPSKDDIARGLAIQKVYESLDHYLDDYNVESLQMVARKSKHRAAAKIVEEMKKKAEAEAAPLQAAEATTAVEGGTVAENFKDVEGNAITEGATVLETGAAAENIAVVDGESAIDMAGGRMPLQESSEGRVNQSIQKARADAEKYKPKIPSLLRNNKIMSPINDNTVKSFINDSVIFDPDVIASVIRIPDENIIPEGFDVEDLVLEQSKRLTNFDHPSFEEEVEKAFSELPHYTG